VASVVKNSLKVGVAVVAVVVACCCWCVTDACRLCLCCADVHRGHPHTQEVHRRSRASQDEESVRACVLLLVSWLVVVCECQRMVHGVL
jgi:hypothetical protein